MINIIAKIEKLSNMFGEGIVEIASYKKDIAKYSMELKRLVKILCFHINSAYCRAAIYCNYIF